jgi:hypothetical protein
LQRPTAPSTDSSKTAAPAAAVATST